MFNRISGKQPPVTMQSILDFRDRYAGLVRTIENWDWDEESADAVSSRVRASTFDSMHLCLFLLKHVPAQEKLLKKATEKHFSDLVEVHFDRISALEPEQRAEMFDAMLEFINDPSHSAYQFIEGIARGFQDSDALIKTMMWEAYQNGDNEPNL